MPYTEVMHKWKAGQLHSGSKSGPKVSSQKQAIAIMLSEKRAAEKGKKEYQSAAFQKDSKKYAGSVSSYKHSRPSRKMVKRSFHA